MSQPLGTVSRSVSVLVGTHVVTYRASDGQADTFYDVIIEVAAWCNLGNGLAGLLGEPTLNGTGTMTAGSTVTLTLANAIPVGTTNLVIGLSLLEAPFRGGVLVPSPDVLFLGLPLDFTTLEVSFTFPSGVPSGTQLFYQHWVEDFTGPAGFSASNGIVGTSP